MALSALHSPPLLSVRSVRLLRNAAAPTAALDLRGAKSPRRRGGRKRRNAIVPPVIANALLRAATSLAANLLWPPGREPPSDLRLLLIGGDGSGTGGGRRGFWGGGWFGGWGRRRRRRRETWLIELLVSMAAAVSLGRTPVEPALLGLRKGASRGPIGAVALGFLLCFVIWCGLRRRKSSRFKCVSWRW